MNKKIIKNFAILFFMIFFSSSLFAENAVVTYVKGKVEVLRNDKWTQLQIGDSLYPNETVSTGFQSEAKIKYNGSLLALGAVTRITIDELSKIPGRETVNLNLATGAVRSKVTHTDETRVSYTVRSPVAVASVRGTDFLITDAGKITCYEGAVVVYSVKQDKKRKSAQAEDKGEDDEVEEESEEAAAENDASDGNSNDSDSETNSDEAPGAYGPATATTSATEIAEDAPTGAVVVGANQTTTFNSSGTPDKPMDTAEKEAAKAKSYGQTASEKESVSAVSSTEVVPTTTKAPVEIQKGSISVTVKFAE